jgi:hypothetical protein
MVLAPSLCSLDFEVTATSSFEYEISQEGTPPRLHILGRQTLVASPVIKNLVVNLIVDSYINTSNLDHIALITRSMRARSVLFQIWCCTIL